MPRDANNVYTLPEAPFTPNTLALAPVMNSNFADIATALTASLTRAETTPFTRTLLDAANSSTARTTLGAASQTDAPPIAWVDLASGATTEIGLVNSQHIRITGTNGIANFGGAPSGTRRQLRFAGILTITHNPTSLALPGGLNITTEPGDCCQAVSLGGGNWVVVDYTPATHSGARALVGATATGAALIMAANATAARTTLAAPPTPTLLGWSPIFAGDGATLFLPPSGTWAYFAVQFDTGTFNALTDHIAGVAAGGANIANGAAFRAWRGFAWRLT